MKRCSSRQLSFLAALLAALAPFAGGCSAPHGAHSTAAVAASTDDRASASAPAARVAAASTEAERIRALAASDSRVAEHTRHLCQEIGPRLTSSSALQRAIEWARDEFASYGLDARLEAWGEFPVGFDRGPSRGALVAPETLPLEFTTPAWTPGTSGPVRGPVVLYPKNEEELAALAGRLAGAWVVTPRFSAGERPARDVKKKIDEALAAAGVAGHVRRAGSRNGELVITDGNHDIAWDELPKKVDVIVRGDQFDRIVGLAHAGTAELEFDLDQRFRQGPVTQYNVIADLVGSEHPDEYVIVGGHIDSWDGAQGAQDNATGVATTLEAARLLAKSGVRPKRTIRFQLWSGEEQGLYGSQGYVRDHADELARISAVLVHDGGTNWLSGLRCTPEMETDLRRAFAPVIELDATKPFEFIVTEGLRNSGDSDHASFLSKGVPAFFWEQKGDADYGFIHHTQNDVLEHVRDDYQRHSALVVALGALGIANLDGLLSRENLSGIEPRRMGVQLEGTKVASVNDGGLAASAGWKDGDVILAIDGVAVGSRQEISDTLQQGGPKKSIRLKRGDGELETVLDWSESPGEKERAARAAKRAAASGK
ncbi:MAG: M20/M25/M40 family metallo-hydrolase [Planctomycetes bacterium]|nr:M20/M25/M40 family metallo-hydrolase [Planctomycetota bacterium]